MAHSSINKQTMQLPPLRAKREKNEEVTGKAVSPPSNRSQRDVDDYSDDYEINIETGTETEADADDEADSPLKQKDGDSALQKEKSKEKSGLETLKFNLRDRKISENVQAVSLRKSRMQRLQNQIDKSMRDATLGMLNFRPRTLMDEEDDDEEEEGDDDNTLNNNNIQENTPQKEAQENNIRMLKDEDDETSVNRYNMQEKENNKKKNKRKKGGNEEEADEEEKEETEEERRKKQLQTQKRRTGLSSTQRYDTIQSLHNTSTAEFFQWYIVKVASGKEESVGLEINRLIQDKNHIFSSHMKETLVPKRRLPVLKNKQNLEYAYSVYIAKQVYVKARLLPEVEEAITRIPGVFSVVQTRGDDVQEFIKEKKKLMKDYEKDEQFRLSHPIKVGDPVEVLNERGQPFGYGTFIGVYKNKCKVNVINSEGTDEVLHHVEIEQLKYLEPEDSDVAAQMIHEALTAKEDVMQLTAKELLLKAMESAPNSRQLRYLLKNRQISSLLNDDSNEKHQKPIADLSEEEIATLFSDASSYSSFPASFGERRSSFDNRNVDQSTRFSKRPETQEQSPSSFERGARESSFPKKNEERKMAKEDRYSTRINKEWSKPTFPRDEFSSLDDESYAADQNRPQQKDYRRDANFKGREPPSSSPASQTPLSWDISSKVNDEYSSFLSSASSSSRSSGSSPFAVTSAASRIAAGRPNQKRDQSDPARIKDLQDDDDSDAEDDEVDSDDLDSIISSLATNPTAESLSNDQSRPSSLSSRSFSSSPSSPSSPSRSQISNNIPPRIQSHFIQPSVRSTDPKEEREKENSDRNIEGNNVEDVEEWNLDDLDDILKQEEDQSNRQEQLQNNKWKSASNPTQRSTPERKLEQGSDDDVNSLDLDSIIHDFIQKEKAPISSKLPSPVTNERRPDERQQRKQQSQNFQRPPNRAFENTMSQSSNGPDVRDRRGAYQPKAEREFSQQNDDIRNGNEDEYPAAIQYSSFEEYLAAVELYEERQRRPARPQSDAPLQQSSQRVAAITPPASVPAPPSPVALVPDTSPSSVSPPSLPSYDGPDVRDLRGAYQPKAEREFSQQNDDIRNGNEDEYPAAIQYSSFEEYLAAVELYEERQRRPARPQSDAPLQQSSQRVAAITPPASVPAPPSPVALVPDTSPSSVSPPSLPSYDEYTVKELKELLRKRNLPVSGNKAELVSRLAAK